MPGRRHRHNSPAHEAVEPSQSGGLASLNDMDMPQGESNGGKLDALRAELDAVEVGTPLLDLLAQLDEDTEGSGRDDFEEAEDAPDRGPQGERADLYRDHIARSDEIFEAERVASNPYVESTYGRKKRHRRNKELRAELEAHRDEQIQAYLEQNPDALTHDNTDASNLFIELDEALEQRYKADKERDPDTLRRQRNKALKKQLRAEAAAEYPDPEEAKKQAGREYARRKEQFGGEKAQAKANANVDKVELKEENKALYLTIVRQVVAEIDMSDPNQAMFLQAYVDSDYEAQRRKSDKEIAKEAKKEAKQEAKLAEMTRKANNKALRTQIEEQHQGSSILTRGKKVDRAYRAQKTRSDKDQDKAQDKQASEFARTLNSDMKTMQLDALGPEATAEERKETKKSVAMAMIVVDDKTRQQKNAELKKHFSREEYRELKVHRAQPDGGGGSNAYKEPKMLVDALLGVSSGGTSAVRCGVKQLGDDNAQNLVIGTKNPVGEYTVKANGTADRATGILGAVGGVSDMVNGGLGLNAALTNRGDPDPAVRALATRDIAKNVKGLAKGGNTTAKGVLTAIKGFAGDNTELAETMQLEALPITGLISSAINFADTTYTLLLAAARVGDTTDLMELAEQENNELLQASLHRVRNADLDLMASSTMDLFVNGASILQNTLVITGVGAPIAVGIKTANAAIGAARTLASAVYSSEKARVEQRADVKFHDAVELEQGDARVARRGRKLLKRNVKYSVQEIINQARDGDATALDYLGQFGMDTADLTMVDDKALRKLILNDLQTEEDAQTLGQQVNGIGQTLRGVKRSVKEKVTKSSSSMPT